MINQKRCKSIKCDYCKSEYCVKENIVMKRCACGEMLECKKGVDNEK